MDQPLPASFTRDAMEAEIKERQTHRSAASENRRRPTAPPHQPAQRKLQQTTQPRREQPTEVDTAEVEILEAASTPAIESPPCGTVRECRGDNAKMIRTTSSGGLSSSSRGLHHAGGMRQQERSYTNSERPRSLTPRKKQRLHEIAGYEQRPRHTSWSAPARNQPTRPIPVGHGGPKQQLFRQETQSSRNAAMC